MNHPSVHPYWQNIRNHIRETVLPSAGNPLDDAIIRGNMFCSASYVDQYERPYIGDQACDSNTAHQKYHLCRLEDAGVQWRDKAAVLEFGGGYGCMASIIGGVYTIFDLPEFCDLQRRHLGSETGVRWATDIESVRGSRPDLMLAMWSLTEAPMPFRYEFIDAVQPAMFWLAQNDRFEDIDNTEWHKSIPGYNVAAFPIEHMPGNCYLLGVRA